MAATARKSAPRKASTERPERPPLKAVGTTLSEGPRYAEVGDVEVFAENLPDKFLHCRELGHLWRPHTASRFADADGGGFARVLRCSRCRTRREQEISMYGLVLANKYVYPEGYQVEGLGRIVGDGRGVLRLQSLVRLTKEED